ncbi:MAG: zf-HC2 domain-containing protein [Polyangia bacterium]
MLSCQDITALVSDYLEGRLTFGQRVRFQLHLGICRGCRRYLAQMKQTVQLLGKMPDEPPPADVQAQLLAQFQTWKRSP